MNRDAWIRHVPLRKDREHTWKQHARGGTLLREVLGILDKWATREAAKDERHYRFVFAHHAAILKNCNKGPRAEGKHFSLIRLKHVLEELRSQHILGKYFETKDGRFGFVVAPHETLCYAQNGVCILPDRSKVFEQAKEPRHWAARAIATLSQHSTRHRDDTQLDTITTPCSTPGLVIGDTQRDTLLDTDQSVLPYDFTDFTDAEITNWVAAGMQPGGPIRVIRLSDVSDEPLNPSYPAFSHEAIEHHEEFLKRAAEKQKQDQTQQQERSFLDSEPRTEGSTTATTPTPKASTMKSTPKDRKRPVLTPEEYAQKREADEEERILADLARNRADVERRLAEKKPEQDRWRQEHGDERCADEIWRPEADRKTYGWTILGDGGVWQQDPAVSARVQAEREAAKAKRRGRR